MRSAASDISGVPNAVIMITAVVRRHLADRRQQREVVRIGQVVVEQHDVERSVPVRQRPQGRFAVARLADEMTAIAQRFR